MNILSELRIEIILQIQKIMKIYRVKIKYIFMSERGEV